MDLLSFIKDVATPVLAVMGTAIGLFQAYKSRKERIREQAEQIGAWWARIDDGRLETKCSPKDSRLFEGDARFDAPPRKDPSRYYVGIVMLNRSQTPIRNLVVYGKSYEMNNGKRGDAPVQTLLFQPILVPGEFISFAVRDNGKSDGRPWTYPEELSAITSAVGKARPIINDKEWEVETFIFEDSAGKCWIRREDGKLSGYRFYKGMTIISSKLDSSKRKDQSMNNPLNYKKCVMKYETEGSRQTEASVYR